MTPATMNFEELLEKSTKGPFAIKSAGIELDLIAGTIRESVYLAQALEPEDAELLVRLLRFAHAGGVEKMAAMIRCVDEGTYRETAYEARAALSLLDGAGVEK
jgi:hypothetical protein